jgi:hypothetical protein
MAAHDSGRLRELAEGGPLRIAACYPRAVRWLFASAGAELPEHAVRVWNMRVETADAVIDGLLSSSNPADASAKPEVPQ